MVEDSTCLMRACCSGQDMCVDILHRYGARLDERSKKSGRTALMKAALWGELDCVRALVRIFSLFCPILFLLLIDL